MSLAVEPRSVRGFRSYKGSVHTVVKPNALKLPNHPGVHNRWHIVPTRKLQITAIVFVMT